MIFQAITAIATAALFLVAWLQIASLKEQVRLAREQAKASFEDGLAAQYRRIMRDIPIEIWLDSELHVLRGLRQSRCRDAIYRYIDLSQEQAFLHEINRVTNETWIEWSKGIKFNMRLKAFQSVWAEVSEKHPDNFNELRELLK